MILKQLHKLKSRISSYSYQSLKIQGLKWGGFDCSKIEHKKSISICQMPEQDYWHWATDISCKAQYNPSEQCSRAWSLHSICRTQGTHGFSAGMLRVQHSLDRHSQWNKHFIHLTEGGIFFPSTFCCLRNVSDKETPFKAARETCHLKWLKNKRTLFQQQLSLRKGTS